MKPRVLILGIDWHGDVAPSLADGFRELGWDARVLYLVSQRRRGVRGRLVDEFLHVRGLTSRARALQIRRATEKIAAAARVTSPDAVVCLSPELLAAESVELLLSRCPVAWWFADDPTDLARRGLGSGRAPVFEYVSHGDSRTYVSHPRWAAAFDVSADYLPYASVYPVATAPRRNTRGVVVVGSPRESRAVALTKLAPVLGPSLLEVWGWGPRARVGLGRIDTSAFRGSLRGYRPLARSEVAEVFRSASVVLNLQDEQMYGAWNPQTFDVMALGVPQVVRNIDPVRLFEHPPLYGHTISELHDLIHAARAPNDSYWRGAAEEVESSHRWSNRAEVLTANLGAVA